MSGKLSNFETDKEKEYSNVKNEIEKFAIQETELFHL